MPTSTLIRRKAQLDLLLEACERRRPARVAIRDVTGEKSTFDTRLLAMDDDAVWIDCPTDGLRRPHDLGTRAEVFFDHEGERYAFTSLTFGRERRHESERHELWAVRLSLPPLVEQRQQREHFRVSLAAFGAIDANFTQAVGGLATFTGQLLNLSCGGIASLADWDDVRDLIRGDVFRTEFTLPGDPQPVEFAVRLAHRRRVRDSLRAVLGWAFCASDNHEDALEKLERVRRFVTQRQRDLLKNLTCR